MTLHFKILFFIVFCFLGLSCENFNSSNKQLTKLKLTPSEKSCIEKVISKDASLGKIRNHSCETISLSETIRNYTTGIGNINFKDCPDKFNTAFEMHRKAWLDMLIITDKYPDLRGEMHDLFKILEEERDKDAFKPLLDNIWKTWEEVESSMTD